MKCSNCGVDNPPAFRACISCGQQQFAQVGQQPRTVASGVTMPRLIEPPTGPPAGPPAGPPRAPAAAGPIGAAPVQQPVSTRHGGPPGRFAKNVTRYLCMAAQLDSSFSQRLIRYILDEPRRAVASSPGVDLETVLRYAISARPRQLVRDALLAGTTVFTVLVLIGRIALGGVSPIRVTIGALLAAWTIVFAEQLLAYYGVVVRRLRRIVFQKDHAPAFGGRRVNARLSQVARADRGNVTVFPGYSPFLGYGAIIGNWSFALNIAEPAAGETVQPFTVQQLHDHIAAQVDALGLPGVAVDDRVLVNGDDLLDEVPAFVEKQILPDRFAAPAASVDATLVQQLLSDSQGRARTYLCVRVAGWSGELVLTVFLRFDITPARDVLFVEASYSLLTPVREKYREVDLMYARVNPIQVLRIALRSTRAMMPRLVTCWINLARYLSSPALRAYLWLRDQWSILGEHSFNYGARMSAREAASERRHQRYFQQLDAKMYAKTVERRVLDALVGFLEDHGIDTAEVNERTTTILNNGVLVTGQGSIRAQTVVAGAGATTGRPASLVARLTESWRRRLAAMD